jgi:hypothetical protein
MSDGAILKCRAELEDYNEYNQTLCSVQCVDFEKCNEIWMRYCRERK